jgi:hypothetical protein
VSISIPKMANHSPVFSFLSVTQGVIEQLAYPLANRSVQKCAGAVHDVIFSVSVRTRLLNIERVCSTSVPNVVTSTGNGSASTGDNAGTQTRSCGSTSVNYYTSASISVTDTECAVSTFASFLSATRR